MILTNGLVFIEGRFIRTDIRVTDGVIAQTGEGLAAQTPEDEQIDLQENYLIPGMIDSHTHGYGGADAMNGADAVLFMSEAYARHGVTSFLPTTASAPIGETAAAVRSIAGCIGMEMGAEILGIHIEGPFFSPDKRGAHAKTLLLRPSAKLFDALCGGHPDKVKLLSLAPELVGAEETIYRARELNVVVSAGHSNASYDQMKEAAARGVTRVTHVFNGMNIMHHREPGVPGAALYMPELFPEIIADGVHVHPAMLAIAANAAGERLCLITDSIMAAGMPDGEYSLAGQRVLMQNNIARSEDGALAGSALTMDQALRNMVALAKIPLEKVIPMATENVARSLRMSDRGMIKAGLLGDLCLMNPSLQPIKTWLRGRLLFDQNA